MALGHCERSGGEGGRSDIEEFLGDSVYRVYECGDHEFSETHPKTVDPMLSQKKGETPPISRNVPTTIGIVRLCRRDEAPPPLSMTHERNHSATREPATRESHSGTAAASRDAGVRFLQAARAAGRAGRHIELAVRLLPGTSRGAFPAKRPTRCPYKTQTELELA